jgi:3',5'-cyclic AMP phosphodiesterase CpdA
MRVLHFTDVHLTVPPSQVPWRDWLGKRLLGEVNYLLRRRPYFADAVKKVAALIEFVQAKDVELVLSTGDHTLLGTEAEYQLAQRALLPLVQGHRQFVHLPGNHDLYLSDTVKERRFERYFGDTLRSDYPEYQVDGSWPLVRLMGTRVAVVAVNSARPNPAPWRASGSISDSQLGALQGILREPRLVGRFVFVLVHHAPLRADGSADRASHGLVNAAQFLKICAQLERGAILHGHIHHCYRLERTGARPAIFNAGSTTHAGREGMWLFELDQQEGRATRVKWERDRYVLASEESFDC